MVVVVVVVELVRVGSIAVEQQELLYGSNIKTNDCKMRVNDGDVEQAISGSSSNFSTEKVVRGRARDRQKDRKTERQGGKERKSKGFGFRVQGVC